METPQSTGLPPVNPASDDISRWFVMRDLSRSNAKLPAWEMLRARHIRHFTPLVWRMASRGGKQAPRQVPYIQDLIFVYGTREALDPLVERVRTFQYRYLRHTWREPMTVPDLEMERFIRAVLVTVRGSKRKRLLVEIPMLLAAAVEVEPEYIKLL